MSAATENTAGRVNGRKRERGYAPYRPQAKARALIENVEEILIEYEDQLPLTIRQIFYRLVGAYDYPKDENAYDRLVEKLGRARRARMIPFDAIRDDGIVTFTNTWYAGVEDFHDETARRARGFTLNRQAGQAQYIELWCEAAGMLHQLHRIAKPYSVPVYSASGFGSLTGNYEIAQRALDREMPTVILHVGDFDPSGESIFTSMTEDAAAFVQADRVIHNLRIEPVRVALTAEQVENFDLPTAPAKKSDSRSKNWCGETCQLEALAPDQLAEIVKAALVDRLDPSKYEDRLAAEAMDRAELLALPAGGAA